MLQLRVIQAEFGDCLILEYGSASDRRYILVDGGPSGTYKKALRAELEHLRQSGGKLDTVVLSHVDNDHVIGLLEFMADILAARSAGRAEIIPIAGLWHNAFSPDGSSAGAFDQLAFTFANEETAVRALPASYSEVFGIREGSRLFAAHQELNIPLNPGFGDGTITADHAPRPLRLDGLEVWILGPTVKKLNRLKKDWLAWLKKVEQTAFTDPVEADKVDRSVPNLSSIMFLAVEDGRRILLTGDGLGQDVIDGLRLSGLLNRSERFHVDVLKLPHHGSARNVNRRFFRTITADTYIISANGKYNNPDLATLIWLVEAVRAQKRKVRILATNPTPSTDQLLENYPPARYGYSLDFLAPGQGSILV